MAGTFTHWMIVESALRRFGEQPDRHRLFATLAARADFAALGSIGPDYPYAVELAAHPPPGRSWADRMHSERTGDFMVQGLGLLQELEGADFEMGLAWLCGYATHLVADSIVHPVVNATVGGLARFSGAEHRLCEMVQDCYLYRAVTGLEIADGHYLERLHACSHPGDARRLHPAVAGLWTEALRRNHPGAGACLETLDPDGWHEHVLQSAGALADPEAARRAGADEAQLAQAKRRSSDLADQELARFVHAVQLPGGGTGHFQRDVFDKVVEQVVAVWARLLVDVERRDAGGCRAYLKNWDLDRGVDADAPYFWR